MANKIVTVYIGRFQPLHLGHVHVLEHALAQSDLVVVLVGSAHQARTIKNPFTYEERELLIQRWKVGANYDGHFKVCPLADQPYNDAKWIQSVQEQVYRAIDEARLKRDEVEIRLTGSDRDDSTWYLSAFPQWKSDLLPKVPEGRDLSATALRRRLFERSSIWDMSPPAWKDVPPVTYKFLLVKFLESEAYDQLQDEYDFIEKYKSAWKAAPYAPTFVTVDNVVIQSGHVLVVERGALPGKGLWALPGGFVDQSERLQSAAIRELVEETGIKVPEGILRGSIRAKEIFDHPDRSLRGRTITTAFLIRLDDTKPLPKVKGQNAPLHETGGKAVVETAKAFWLPIHEARANSQNWFEDHHAILDTMLGMIKD
jgi:bifunctional NMN adenylyltransferase/nudix hydrolase